MSSQRLKQSGSSASSSGTSPLVQDMMKKALTTSDSFFQERNAVKGVKDRKDEIRLKRAEQKNTLSQWYGMKKTPLSKEQKQEIELLQYRNFLHQDTKHIAPKKASDAPSEFVEFGYFADVGRSKRRRIKSFADEWVEENPEFLDVIKKRMKTNIKLQKKSKIQAAKKAARQAVRERNKHESKRKKKGILYTMDSGLSSASEEFCWGDDSTERSSTHLEEEPVSNDVEINENDIFQERLKDIACRSQRLLSILNNNYAEGTTKTPVSGINKLKHKIEREVLNATHCLSMLNEMSQISNTSDCDVNEENSMEWSRCVAKAKLISQCSGITTLEMCVALLLSEPEVSSVCAPFSSCHTLTDISQSRLQTSTKNRSVEVDIVSCGGRRWIKVRGARHRDEGDKSDEHQLRQWIEGLNNAARSRYVPFQENPHIYIVFSTPPPTRLCSLLEAEKCPYSVLSPEGCKRMLNSDLHPPFLPPLVLKPQFICWDTTALVAFCSESCYTSFNWKREERLTALESFKVLKEQQRRELSDFSDRERAVHDFIHPYLERYTTEITLEELKATIRRQICQSMVRSCEVLSELPQEDSCCYLPDLTWLRDILEAKLYYLPADRSHYWDDTKWLMNSTFVSRTGDATPLIHATRIGNEDGSKVVRNWVMADISYTEFKWMIETIAGWNECHRAWELLQHCVVVSTGFLEKTITAFRSTSFEPILSNEQPHCNSKEPSCRACVSVPYPNSVGWYNSKTNSISLRNKVVFGLGDALHAITLTSNKQVWSKMLDKGVTLSVALHPSRALTELKMSKQPRREGEKVPPAFSWTLDTK